MVGRSKLWHTGDTRGVFRIMNNDEMIEYIKNVTWDDVKDLSHEFNRISYINISNKKYDAYVYLVIINSNKPKHKYLGYEKSTHFMVSYTGTPVTHIEEYSQDLKEYEYRIICLAIGTERQMRTKEGNLLETVKKKNWDAFYNETTQTFLKGYNSSEAVKRIKASLDNIPDTILPKETWHNMDRFQTRKVPEEPGLVSSITLRIEDSKGRWIEENHKGVLALKDYYGPGKHLRLGSYHTIEASIDSVYIKTLKGKLVPEELWDGIDILGLEYLADMDNKRDGEDTRKPTDREKALGWCRRAIETYGIHHTDDMIKDYLIDCGFISAEMQKYFWPTLRKEKEDKEANANIPDDHQLIDYHNTAEGKKRVQDLKDKWESNSCHCIVVGTNYFHSNWEGLPEVVMDLSDENLLKKKFWKIFTFHKNQDAKKNWPAREIEMEKLLKNLISKFANEHKIKFDIEALPYSEPKENLLDDKKAA